MWGIMKMVNGNVLPLQLSADTVKSLRLCLCQGEVPSEARRRGSEQSGL